MSTSESCRRRQRSCMNECNLVSFDDAREVKYEGGAYPDFAFDTNHAAVIFHEFLCKGKAESDTLGSYSCGEEGFEDFVHMQLKLPPHLAQLIEKLLLFHPSFHDSSIYGHSAFMRM